MNTDSFYIVARESGSVEADLPLWATREENPLQLGSPTSAEIARIDLPDVPGAFQLLHVFDNTECKRLIEAAESMGYTQDAAVSLGRHIRHNMNLNWIVDSSTAQIIWSRVAAAFSSNQEHFLGAQPLGLNQRFRFYRYEKGDYFSAHTDGAWPGSQVVDGRAVADAFGDRYSLYTFLIFLNDDFTGGATEFYVNSPRHALPASNQNEASISGVRTPKGGVLCFPHGTHPLHCSHSSEIIAEGIKYIIRSDVLFSL